MAARDERTRAVRISPVPGAEADDYEQFIRS